MIGGALAASLERNAVRGAAACVALSGGLDSVVLLHGMRAVAARYALRLTAMHVNHGLSPNARKWEQFCRDLCARLRVPLTVRRVRVERRGRGLEAAARAARYAALAGARADVVVLAHQLDDQAETVLFNLLRGAGLPGASGMAECGPLHGAPDSGMRALRPMLGVGREDIEAYARLHELDWVEDESNADEMLTRNWVRRKVAPLLAARFPRWREGLARAAAHFSEAQGLLAEQGAVAAKALPIEALRRAGVPRAKLLLRAFLRAHGIRAPGAARLGEMLRQLLTALPDARVELRHDGRVLRRYRGELVVEAGGEPAGTPGVTLWRGEPEVALPAFGGRVAFRKLQGAGIDAALLESGTVTFRARQGGERLRLAAGRPSRTLKNLFQESGIPAWERDRMPLLYCGADLVWVPALGIAAGYRAAKGSAGVVPEWRAGTRKSLRD
ncbi:MAG: tRNA lysidine(34) synthetase TilS [Proteobacteria bacterium]|nr:tRNA lysidine(34) synthetase TilS [Pseudomonadota bacterium]